MVKYRDISKELDLVEFIERGITNKVRKTLGINRGNIFKRTPWRIKEENYLLLNVMYMQWSSMEASFGTHGMVDLIEARDGRDTD